MNSTRITLLTLCLLVLSSGTTYAEVGLPVRNELNRPVWVWAWQYTIRSWREPEYIGPTQRKTIYFNDNETYFLTVLDEDKTELRIGRYNISSVLRQNPRYEVSIGRIVRYATTHASREVWCPRCGRYHKLPNDDPPVPVVTEEIWWTTRSTR